MCCVNCVNASVEERNDYIFCCLKVELQHLGQMTQRICTDLGCGVLYCTVLYCTVLQLGQMTHRIYICTDLVRGVHCDEGGGGHQQGAEPGHQILDTVIHHTAVLQYTVDTRYTDTHNSVT